jgi:NADH-quinone oxidoreductase subunit L
MLVVVNTVSALVHLYSIGYMHDDPHRPRFFAYLSLFTFAMLMLVTADNLVQMFFGWEGVGLASYLLIGFWYKKPSANAAAMKAFIVNRVGDFGFALGIFGVFVLFGSIAFDTIFASTQAFIPPRSRRRPRTADPLNFLGYELDRRADRRLPAALHGRHGQVGAVPAAHLAAGRHGRPDPGVGADPCRDHGHRRRLHGGAPVADLRTVAPALTVVIVIGAFTAFFAATVGLVQNDIKRVIAYSTCSQLGYMFVAIGVGAYSAGIFHLFTHAFFKALLFLGAGSVIHAMHHEQDMRNMGGLRKLIPWTYCDDGRSARWR